MSEIKERVEAILPENWKFIEETISSGVYAVKDPKQEFQFIRVCSPSEVLENGFVFEVLTMEECRTLGLVVEESAKDTEQPYYVEETTPEPWNPQQESLEDYKRRIGSSPKTAIGNVDPQAIEKLRGELEEERERAKTAEDKLVMVAQAQFERKKKELDAPDYITDPKTLMAWKESQDSSSRPPAGTVGLAGQTRSGGKGKGFKSYQDMIEYLQREEALGQESSPEAKAILAEFHRKSLKARRQSDKGFSLEISEKDPRTGKELTLQEMLARRYRDTFIRKKWKGSEDMTKAERNQAIEEYLRKRESE